MAKKIDEQDMDLFYNKEENPSKVIKKNRKNKKSDTTEKKDDFFSFDNEIVIGVTKKQINSKKTKNNTSKKQPSKVVQKKQEQTKQVKKKKQNKTKNIEQEKLMKKKTRIVHIIKYSMILILFITVVLCAMFSPLFNIKDIQVVGNEKITQSEIISLSKIQLEENTFKLSKTKITRQIKENAYIDTVKITRRLPSTIVIEIEERKPTYLLEYAGSYIYIDKKGYMLEISTQKLELPILQGGETETTDFVVGNRMCEQDLEKLLSVYKIMEIAQSNEISNLITKIDIENEKDFKLIFESKDKVAYLGDSSNLMDKIPIIKKIIEEEEGKAGEIFVNMDLNKENPMFRERV